MAVSGEPDPLLALAQGWPWFVGLPDRVNGAKASMRLRMNATCHATACQGKCKETPTCPVSILGDAFGQTPSRRRPCPRCRRQNTSFKHVEKATITLPPGEEQPLRPRWNCEDCVSTWIVRNPAASLSASLLRCAWRDALPP